MTSRPQLNQSKASYWETGALLFVLVVAFSIYMTDTQAFVSGELEYSDTSTQGLPLVPASCESNPPFQHFIGECTCPTGATPSTDAQGYRVNNSESARQVLRNGVFFCVTNSTGKNYYIPGKTVTELQRFMQQASWITCAQEGGTCTFSGTKAVRYGANGIYRASVHTNSVPCTNAEWGDPVPTVAKHCEYWQSNVPGLELY